MISDVLYEAIEAIEEYLNWEEPVLAYKRGTPIRERIEALVDEMKAIELILNTPPSQRECEESKAVRGDNAETLRAQVAAMQASAAEEFHNMTPIKRGH